MNDQAPTIWDVTKDVTELKITSAKTTEHLKAIDSKVDDIGAGVKDIHQSLIGDAKSTNKLLKGWVFKLLMVLIGAGGVGAAVNGAVNAMADDKPPAVEKVEAPDGN